MSQNLLKQPMEQVLISVGPDERSIDRPIHGGLTEATPPTPTPAGRGRWGRRRTGWRRCCPGWASRRCAGSWRTRSSPPSRCSSRSLRTQMASRSAKTRSNGFTFLNSGYCTNPSTACGLPGTSRAWSPAGPLRHRTPRWATGGRPGAGR